MLRRPSFSQIHSRITLVVLLQALVLTVGLYVSYQAVREGLGGHIEGMAADNSRAVAESLARVLDDLPPAYDPGHPSWAHADDLINELRLGSGGYASLVDAEGLGIWPGWAATSEDASRPGLGAVCAEARTAGGVSVRLHQPESAMAGSVAAVRDTLLGPKVAIGVMVLLLSTVTGLVMMRRHARALRVWGDRLEQTVSRRSEQLRVSRETVAIALAKLAEYRDNETGRHIMRISMYCVVLAGQLRATHPEIDDEWIERLRIAAMLHDIGKVAVPDAILRKPGKLNRDEYEVMKRHTLIGADTLIAVHHRIEQDPLIAMAVEICLYHHERWDGAGYPYGISGDHIPLAARITAVADVFDALISPRVYKPALPPAKVRELIVEGAGTQFDAEVVDAFLVMMPTLVALHTENTDVIENYHISEAA